MICYHLIPSLSMILLDELHMNNRIYRKVWESVNGKIPKDDFNRSYEIHHIDGNHTNNDITNLKLVTIEEHYNIHFDQGDYAACNMIAKRMAKTPEELSKTISELNKLRIGSLNPFYGKTHSAKTIEKIKMALTGRKNGPRTESTKKLIKSKLLGRTKSLEHHKAIKDAHNTEEYLTKIRKRIIVDGILYDSVKSAIENGPYSRTQLYGMIKKNSTNVSYA